MCGIAGMIGVPADVATATAPRLLAALGHRGPDGHGVQFVVSETGPHPAVLVHTRLAILETSEIGAQPMRDHPPDGTSPNWVTFNGEIFNYQDLHAPLEAAGWPCRTRSDTEVILQGYRAWGTSFVEKANGMFAWCLVDPAAGTAWLARDPLGVKPLYVCRPRGGGFLFASEVRTLLAAGPELVPPKLSRTAVESFLAQGAVFGRDAIVDGVKILAPGESLEVDWNGCEIRSHRYWSLPAAAASPTDRAEAVERVAAALRRAVRRQLIADVPLGVFLSGGIDSAALAVCATEVAGSRLRTLTIGFDEAAYDESETAQAVARALGTDHTALRLNAHSILDEIPRFLASVDQPTVDGANTFVVSQAARRAGLTVALSGLGGDELFGGYASFRDVPRSGMLRSRLGPFSPIARLGLRSLGSRRASKAVELLARPNDAIHRYLLRRELSLPRQRRAAQPLPDGCDPCSGLTRQAFAELQSEAHDPDAENQVSRLELRGYMRDMLLRDSDAFSMAAPIELRVPLLDYELVETVLRLPGTWKTPDPRPKPLLIDAAGPRLPELLRNLPKKGFTFPWGPWFRAPLAAKARKAIDNRDLWTAIGIDPAAPQTAWQAFDRGVRSASPLEPLAWIVLEDYVARHGLCL